jgi:L-asparaginase
VSTDVAVISLGGTIAMGHRGDDGLAVSLGATDFARLITERRPDLEVSGINLAHRDSSELTMDDLAILAKEITRVAALGVRRVIVTTGTDSLEEIAFGLERVGPDGVTVVVTGAMRSPTLESHDGPANLVAALSVLSSPACETLGVVVVMNDEIHGADFVRKSHATSASSFTSYPGPLGWVANDEALLVTRPAHRRARLPLPLEETPRVVPLLTTYLGDGGHALRTLASRPLDGVVIEAFGSGRLAPGTAEVARELASRLPVVIASRTGAGLLERSTYSAAGSEGRLFAAGVLNAGWLTGVQARLLLELGLRTGATKDLPHLFEQFQT